MRASTGHSLAPGQRFSLPPELERSAPRDVGLTTGGRALLLVAWLLLAGALAAGVALYLEALRQSDAAIGLRSAAASRRPRSSIACGRRRATATRLLSAVHFEANGARIDGESRMQKSVWRELRTGSTVPVRYLPDNPRRFVLAGQRRKGMPFAVPFVVSSILAAIALCCLAAVRWQRRLLSEGRAAPATVTAVRKTHGSSGETHREMVYEFRVLAGTIATGKAAASKSAAVGATISVVYDPERPKLNRPYPFSLVTLNREW